jgi:zinc transport system permease protein
MARRDNVSMDWSEIVVSPFSFGFMRDALHMSLLIAVMCGMLGILLVPRGLSMLGDGLAHATLGGVGGGLLLGLAPENALWAAMPFAILLAIGIAWLGRKAKLQGDAALGVFFSVSLAAGIAAVHIASRRGVGIDIESILFGNILAVQASDVLVVVALSVVCVFILAWAAPKIAYAGFYPDMAAMSGVRVVFQEYLLMALTAVVTVTAVRAVGVLLVSAYLVIPTVTARMLSRRLGSMMLLSAGTGVLGSATGLIMSYHFDIPSGAAMTLVLGIIFGVALGVRGLRQGV